MDHKLHYLFDLSIHSNRITYCRRQGSGEHASINRSYQFFVIKISNEAFLVRKPKADCVVLIWSKMCQFYYYIAETGSLVRYRCTLGSITHSSSMGWGRVKKRNSFGALLGRWSWKYIFKFNVRSTLRGLLGSKPNDHHGDPLFYTKFQWLPGGDSTWKPTSPTMSMLVDVMMESGSL